MAYRLGQVIDHIGLRPYHPGYFAAFLLDPDGNNIEIKADERVTHRSAAFVDVSTG